MGRTSRRRSREVMELEWPRFMQGCADKHGIGPETAELIFKQLQDVLQKLNVERVPAQGEPFDPRVHEAIEMVESNAAPDHHVLEELQPGYRIKGRLLRPAMVRVAKSKG